FSYLHLHKGLDFKTCLAFPEGQDKIHEFTTERPTRKNYTQTHKHTSAGEVDIEHQLSQQFAKEVAQYLDQARTAKKFEELVIIAPPKFLGDLRAKLSTGTAKVVKATINKELTHAPTEEVMKQVEAL
ncbi:MAG: host attachment protein, partial [Bdellovibrionales bacterium]|nr:host attachment protein [Bdellovibrionales bacterium]